MPGREGIPETEGARASRGRTPGPPRLRAVIADDEPPARRRLRALLDEIGGVEVIAECADGVEAVTAIEEGSPDVVFLDVRMPGLDGFEVVEAVGVQRMPPVVFGTAYGEHAVRAFDVHAADYLVKPFDRKRLERTLARVRDRIAGDEPAPSVEAVLADAGRGRLRRIPVRVGARIRIVEVDALDHLEADGNYVRLHAGRETLRVRGTLSGFERRLDPRAFVRIHRGTIVRIGAVRELEPLFQGEYAILLRSGVRVRSSRGYRDALRAVLELG